MSAEKAKPCVEYNWLSPNCGIKVSNICLGGGTFGTTGKTFTLPGNADEAQAHAILDRYVELGGNFIDTDNIYNCGPSEEIIGSWLKKHDRSSVIIATETRSGSFGPQLVGPNEAGLSRGAIMTNIDRSLKRLGTDYVDIYYSHAWDAGVKLEETLRAFNDLVRSGKVRYIGVSNVTAAQLQKIVDYNKFMGFDPIVTLQQEYSLLERNNDIEVIPTLKSEGVSLLPYSPLKGGLLTGKFKRDQKNVQQSLAGTRLAWTAEKPEERTMGPSPNVEDFRENEAFWTLSAAMETIGKEHGKSQTQVALRWLLQKDFIPSVIIGAKTVQQLEDNMGAATGWKLTEEQMKKLDELSAFSGHRPVYPYQAIERMNLSRVRP